MLPLSKYTSVRPVVPFPTEELLPEEELPLEELLPEEDELVFLGVAVAAGAFLALEEYSFSKVRFPALPSAAKPLLDWKAFTAASVAAPKVPSTLPLRYPKVFRACCIRFTSSLLSPSFSVLTVPPLLLLVGVGVGATLVLLTLGGKVGLSMLITLPPLFPLEELLPMLEPLLEGGAVGASFPKFQSSQLTVGVVGVGCGAE